MYEKSHACLWRVRSRFFSDGLMVRYLWIVILMWGGREGGCVGNDFLVSGSWRTLTETLLLTELSMTNDLVTIFLNEKKKIFFKNL